MQRAKISVSCFEMYVSKHEMAVSKHEMYISKHETEIFARCGEKFCWVRRELLRGAGTNIAAYEVHRRRLFAAQLVASRRPDGVEKRDGSANCGAA